MKKILLALVIPLILTGCKPGDEKAISLAKSEVAANLKDPASAQFRNVKVSKMTDAEDGRVVAVVCGEINGKNGFGAYAGFHPFFVELSMKSKGIFSKGVDYALGDHFLSTSDTPTPPAYTERCQ
ncbi:membrane lipoprotein lipid attachment site-containing protein [Escherichia coli]|uniref:lipoprotein n=2 Tax=Enterobacter TaxID=547 RepID=UPI001C22DCA6|nr:membrane lipoprotein lipid attachment site-containing protein [Enterobacter hormaechei]ELX1420886.1 membrane lipoprotein lipid attachment site-containing protein [Escherichia coli]QXC19712.1 membrane lipoprotein lipid attachment site-containing protein [Enterobacter hormaechei]